VHTRCVVGENFVSPQCSVSMRLTTGRGAYAIKRVATSLAGWLVVGSSLS